MIWLLYNDYLKESIKTATFAKFLKWYVWVIFSAIVLIDIGLYFAFIVYNVLGFQLGALLVAALAGLYFGNEIKKVRRKKVGTDEDIHNKNVATMQKILKNRKLYTKNQVDLLIVQINEELPKLKSSDSLLKPFYTLTTLIVIPIIIMLTKWVLDKHSDQVYLIIIVILLMIMVFSLYTMIKPLVEGWLDIEYRRMTQLKVVIQDIKIIDFSH